MTIELADGTVFDGEITHYRNEIWVRATVVVMTQQMLNLIDKSKTKTIVQHLIAKDIIYTGFTVFGEVRIKDDGSAIFYLVGDENSTIEEKWNIPEIYLPKEFGKEQNQNGSEQDIGSSTSDGESGEISESADRGNDER